MKQIVTLTTLLFSWPQGQHFPLDCQAACYHRAPRKHLVALIPGMGHGHAAAYNPPDSYAFAESIVRDGRPWCLQTGTKLESGTVRVEFAATKPLDRALLISTTDTDFTGKRKWTESSAIVEKRDKGWHVTVPLPAGTTAWFVNARSGELTASSDYQERK